MADHHLLADEVWGRGISNLRDEITARGLTYRVLARQAGIHKTLMSRIATGDAGGSASTHGAIANALGRDPGLFFPRNELELTRAEALRTLDGRERMSSQIRAQAQTLSEAADAIDSIERLAS